MAQIEIFDHAYWVECIEQTIARYQTERAKIDTAYEDKWRKSHWFFKPKLDAKPPHTWTYPTFIFETTIERLKRLRNMLLTTNTGKARLTDEEINLIGAPIRGKRL